MIAKKRFQYYKECALVVQAIPNDKEIIEEALTELSNVKANIQAIEDKLQNLLDAL